MPLTPAPSADAPRCACGALAFTHPDLETSPPVCEVFLGFYLGMDMGDHVHVEIDVVVVRGRDGSWDEVRRAVAAAVSPAEDRAPAIDVGELCAAAKGATEVWAFHLGVVMFGCELTAEHMERTNAAMTRLRLAAGPR